MDRYLTTDRQKRDCDFTKLGQVVCILGKTGIGKSWAVTQALQPAVHFTPEILRSHQGTIDFLNKIDGTELHVILDDYECVKELVGMSEIKKPPTSGIFAIISQVPIKLDFDFVTYEFPLYSPDEMRKMAPGVTDDAIRKARGDLRYILRSLEFKGDAQDLFQDAKEFILGIVSTKTNTNPIKFLGHAVQEPGNVASILHENYPDSKADMAKMMEYFSEADILETRVYDGEWGLYAYYNMYGCILPAIEIAHTLKEPLRPGSTWTKHQNMCMRTRRIAAISRRRPGDRLTIADLLVLRDYAENGNIDILKEYSIEPSDIDVMNHLSPLRRVKPKVVAGIKKALAG